jgi:predicted ABC-type ATPase
MAEQAPSVIVIAGPNGAGKSTAAHLVFAESLGVMEFVNADAIARGLSEFQPEKAALEAGRIMLKRLDDLARQQLSFAFETTLASKSFAPKIVQWRKNGYRFHLLYLWLPNPDQAIARVLDRVRQGGHNVPEDVIRRRYAHGLANFFRLYQPMADEWHFYDNADTQGPKLLATGRGSVETVADPITWNAIKTSLAYG